MTTINVSIPEKLKSQAQELVERGFYASFSDVVRDALRQTLANNKYDLWADEAARDLKEDKVVVLKNKRQIRKYFDSL